MRRAAATALVALLVIWAGWVGHRRMALLALTALLAALMQFVFGAVKAGRLAYLAGRMPKKRYADPSSPLAGLI